MILTKVVKGLNDFSGLPRLSMNTLLWEAPLDLACETQMVREGVIDFWRKKIKRFSWPI